MGFLHISPKLTVPTWSAFRRHCHRFLAIGYQEALPRIQNDPDEETDITGYICEALHKWFRAHPRDSFSFVIQDDPPLRDTGRTGKRRRRTDIIISYAAGRRPESFSLKRSDCIEPKPMLHATPVKLAWVASLVGVTQVIARRPQ